MKRMMMNFREKIHKQNNFNELKTKVQELQHEIN